MRPVSKPRKPNYLRRYRKARNLSQRQVAAILGLKSSGIISRWEHGARFPATPNLLKLAVLYRTLADSLYLDEVREFRAEIHHREARLLKNHCLKGHEREP